LRPTLYDAFNANELVNDKKLLSPTLHAEKKYNKIINKQHQAYNEQKKKNLAPLDIHFNDIKTKEKKYLDIIFVGLNEREKKSIFKTVKKKIKLEWNDIEEVRRNYIKRYVKYKIMETLNQKFDIEKIANEIFEHDIDNFEKNKIIAIENYRKFHKTDKLLIDNRENDNYKESNVDNNYKKKKKDDDVE